MSHISIKQGNKINYHYVGAIVSIVLVSILTCYLYDKSMPTAEGWYSYYAKCILNGDIVYQDFEYLFTPVYMYIIAGFIKCFGYNIIALRVLGIFIYALIALIVYLTLSRVFSVEASVIGSVTGVYYLQSEVYTVFYDYVRVMDIFAYLSALFMVLCLIKWQNKEVKTKFIFLWGACTAVFFLIKQNMGGLFCVYSVLLIIFCSIIFSWTMRTLIYNVFKFSIAFSVPVIILAFIAIKANIVNAMINSVFFGAIEAKGGIFSILFRWIKNGFVSYAQVFLLAVFFFILLIINRKLTEEYPSRAINKKLLIAYSLILTIGSILICRNESLGTYYSTVRRLDVAVIFVITVVLLAAFAIVALYHTVKKKQCPISLVPVIGLLGVYFTLCYGAGMSGGLSIGESALGLGVVICILFDSFKFKGGIVAKGCVAAYCIYLCFACYGFKIVNPCLWWGIDESNIYEATVETNIPILEGIKVSESTKNMYESIVDIVGKNTSSADSIYCFPQIPIFYLMCNRGDPGVYGKVQWFDVSTDGGINRDIEILHKNLPKAIIIYNLYDSTYAGHEEGFNFGQKSGTRNMRESLYEIVNDYNYAYQGTFLSEDNNISVYTLRKNDAVYEDIFTEGIGTAEDPYIIDSVGKLVNLSMLTNQGYDFENTYFLQNCEIDLSDIVWVPAGYNGENIFEGNYDYNGYSIQNINSSLKNSSLPFGTEVFKY